MAKKKKTKKPQEFFILMGTASPRCVAHTLEELVSFGEAHPYFYDGAVLRYVAGEDNPTRYGSFTSVRAQLKSAEDHD